MIESLKTDFLKSEDKEIIKQGIEMLLTLEMVEESYEAFKTNLEQRVVGKLCFVLLGTHRYRTKSLSPTNRWKTYGLRIVRQC